MAKTWSATAAAAAAVAFSVLGASGRATAAPAAIRTVVLHVSDLADVSERDRTEAEKLATRAYERIGVRLAWTNGDAAYAPADGAFHLDVIILPGSMADRMNANPTAFGQASHVTRRAYIYFSRIEAYAVSIAERSRLRVGDGARSRDWAHAASRLQPFAVGVSCAPNGRAASSRCRTSIGNRLRRFARG